MATKIERILAPARGLNTFDGPSAIPRDMAPELVNFLPGAGGKIYGRAQVRPLQVLNNVLYDWATAAGVTASGRGLIDTRLSFEAFGEKLVVSVGGYSGLLTYSDLTTGAGSYVNLGARDFLRTRGNAQLESLYYAINDAVSPRIINSVDQAGTVVAFSANAPRNGTFIFEYLDTLWVFGGRDTPAGSTTDEYSSLYYVNPGTTPADTAAAWQTSGITNKIVVGDDALNDRAVAAVPFQKTLLLFKENSLWQMVGTSPENFEIRKIASVGCEDVPVATDNAVYWYTPSNILMRFSDGGVAPVALQIRREFSTNQPVVLSKLGGGHILITSNVDSFMYDEISGAAAEISVQYPPGTSSTISSPLSQSVAPQPLKRAILTKLDGTRQLTAVVGDTLNNLVYLPLTFPIPSSTDTYGDRAPGTDVSAPLHYPYTRVVYSWTSRTVRPSSPMDSVRLVKLYIDYVCQSAPFDSSAAEITGNLVESTDDATAPEVLYVKVLAEDGTELLAETALPAQGWHTTDLDRRRHIIELNGVEASEFKVQVYTKEGSNSSASPDYTGAALEIPRSDTLEIHDVWVEYEEAQRRVAV